MKEQRTAVIDLAQLVARLRAKGLRIHTSQYLTAHQMLLVLASQGRLFDRDPAALASHLAPIFSGSPEEQRIVREETIAWRRPPRSSLQPPGGASRPRRWRFVAAMIAVFVALIVGAWITAVDRARPPGVSNAPGTTLAQGPPPEFPPPSATIETSFEITEAGTAITETFAVPLPPPPIVAWGIIIKVGLGVGAVWFCGLWLAHLARRTWVVRRLDAVEDASLISLEPEPSMLTELSATAVRKIAAGLRRGRAAVARELSVVRTVEATARAGGFISPQFSPRVATPEYLVLIERLSAEDHSAQLVHGWIEQLHGRHVLIDCYEFETDPRVCRHYATVRWHSLASLIARHHRATVLLCAESEVCFDALTGLPQQWLKSLAALPNRVLLTMRPRYHWSRHERSLIESGLIVLPATPAGFASVAEMDRDSRQPNLGAAKYAREYPPLVAFDATRWIDRSPAPDPLVVRLQRELIDYLGAEGYVWLCACAIYPRISWRLTLALLDSLIPANDELARRRALEEQLPALARLPWFRHGVMPDWLRQVLIAQLPAEIEIALRHQLDRLLQAWLAKPGADRSRDEKGLRRRGLSIAFRPSAIDIVRAAPVGSAIRDAVFMDFLAGVPADPLSLRLSGMSLAHAGATGKWLRWGCGGWRRAVSRRAWMEWARQSALMALLMTTVLYVIERVQERPTPVTDAQVTFLIAASPPATSQIGDIAVARDRSLLLIATVDTNRVIVWDLARQAATAQLATDSPALAVAISPSADRLAAVSQQGTVTVWERSGQLVSSNSMDRIEVQAPNAARLRFSDDGAKLAAVWNGSIGIYSDSQWGMTGDIAATDVAFDPLRPAAIEAATRKGRVRWDVEGNRRITEASDGAPTEAGIVFSPDGKRLAFSERAESGSGFAVEVGKFNRGDGNLGSIVSYMYPKFTFTSTVVGPLQWSPDSRVLAYWPTERRIRLVNAQDGKPVYEGPIATDAGSIVLGRFQTFEQSPNELRFTRESLRIAAAPIPRVTPELERRPVPAPATGLSLAVSDAPARGTIQTPSDAPSSAPLARQDAANVDDPRVGYWRHQSGEFPGNAAAKPSPALYIQRVVGQLVVTECDAYVDCLKATPNPDFFTVSERQLAKQMAVLDDGRLRLLVDVPVGGRVYSASIYYTRSQPSLAERNFSDPATPAGMTCGPIMLTPNLHEVRFDVRDADCRVARDGKYCFKETKLVVEAAPGFVFGQTARPIVQCVRDNEGSCGWNGLPYSNAPTDHFNVTATSTQIEATILTSSRDIGVRLCASASVDPALRGKRVLWVSDFESGDIPYLELRRLGVRVEPVLGTEAALHRLEQEQFQVVVADFRRRRQPVVNYSFVEMISASVPVIIYTTDSQPELIKQANSRGAYDETDDPQRLLEIMISALRSTRREPGF